MNWKLAKFTVIDFSLSRIFLVSSNPGDEFEIQDDEDVDVLRTPKFGGMILITENR